MATDTIKNLIELKNSVGTIVIYRNLLKDPIIKKFNIMLNNITEDDKTQAINTYYEILNELLTINNLSDNPWRDYINFLIATDENIFSMFTEKHGRDIQDSLLNLVIHDIQVLKSLVEINWMHIDDFLAIPNGLASLSSNYESCAENFLQQEILHVLENVITPNSPKLLADAFYKHGAGKFALYKAFNWNGKLKGIKHTDEITFNNLIGYDSQKATLLQNTEAFLQGKPANNVLLFGDRGTGKSSSIKALLNKYAEAGLRVIELAKHQLQDFNKILDTIRDRSYRFIIFIDDLSFEEFETEYKYLKALIEGGIEKRPENVLIYATSNRRHLIKEVWADRDKTADVHIADTMQEKLSLVDRFGITITFTTPDQDDYLNIIYELAKQEGLTMSQKELREQALHWAMWHNGRSGRTARQFINNLLGTTKS